MCVCVCGVLRKKTPKVKAGTCNARNVMVEGLVFADASGEHVVALAVRAGILVNIVGTVHSGTILFSFPTSVLMDEMIG